MSNPSAIWKRLRTASLRASILIEAAALVHVVVIHCRFPHTLVFVWFHRRGLEFFSVFILLPWFLAMVLVRMLFVLVELPSWTSRRPSGEAASPDSPPGAASQRQGLARLVPKHRDAWLVACGLITIAAMYWNYIFCAFTGAASGRIAH